MRNLIPSFIQERDRARQFEGQFDAFAMFVDVPDFTAMTQALMAGGREGAEIVAIILNKVFELMVNEVDARGGFISGFAGDAFTAVFPVDEKTSSPEHLGVQVLTCAEKLQAIFHQQGEFSTRFGTFRLKVKVGISYGEVYWAIAGTARKIYFFRGGAIDGCAVAEHHAQKGEILFDEQAARWLPSTMMTAEPADGQCFRLQSVALPFLAPLPEHRRHSLPLRHDVVAQFFPKALIDLKEMGEFRHVVSIFISFQGIATLQEFDAWTAVLLKNITTFSGYFNRLTFGDKGAVILCGFGAPVTFERMVERALDFMLAVRADVEACDSLAGLTYKAGITYGIAYAGISGGEKQCEYTFYGDVVNLAARLMVKAQWGTILVSEAIVQNALSFDFAYQGDFYYKGFAQPIPTYAFTGHTFRTRGRIFHDPLIGRNEELQRLRAMAAPIFRHQFAGLIAICGEAGIGKSRLADALREDLSRKSPLSWFNCPADQILRKPLHPFKTCFRRYFLQSSEHSEADNLASFEEKYDSLLVMLSSLPEEANDSSKEELVNELRRVKAILAAQIGLFWENSLWEQLDARGKYENTLYAIKTFFLACSLVQPVVLELEDCQWFDDDSIALLHVLTRNISQYPLLLLSTLRYNDDGTPMRLDLEDVVTHEFALDYFAADDVRHYAETLLQGKMSEDLWGIFLEKTKGNPFFIQQMARYFIDNHIVCLVDDVWQVTQNLPELPDTINAILMARLDRLAESIKEVVKVAAVIGQEFDILLVSRVLKKNIVSHMKTVEQKQICEPLQEFRYIFKHVLLRETAYEMQLRTKLRELHRLTAEAMESVYSSRLGENAADIAFHYEHAGENKKAIIFLKLAADDAKAKFHNQEALRLYDRVMAQNNSRLDAEETVIEICLKKCQILELIGDWEGGRQVAEYALTLSRKRENTLAMAQASRMLGLIARRTGRYAQAMTWFDQALTLFERLPEKEGIGLVFSSMGVVHWQQENYEAAIQCYEKALHIAEELGNVTQTAKNANNLGIIHDVKGDYATAMQWYTKSLRMNEVLHNRQERAKVLNNMGECHRETLGDYDTAMGYYTQSLRIAEELGDKLQMTTTLGNIGHVRRAQKNFPKALQVYGKAIAIARELDSKYFLGEYLIGKAETLLAIQAVDEARQALCEGVRLVNQLGRKELLAQGQVLEARIAAISGKLNG